ncbi:MBL fold metallo-hydrolase [Aeromicrobium sp.]|uniref:MBL fold metallo-hydrolase n=1 Tax=Aeromicrobium sp. TaxID=1871063 RepID=UPI003D6B56F0
MQITEAGDGVFAVEGSAVNWTLIAEGDALTLVDAGYPGDHDDVIASISEIGFRLSDVVAVLVTHAHVDHIGSLPRLLEAHPVPVLLSPTEARHARREYLEQAGTAVVVRNLWRPRVLPWAVHLMRKGAMNDAVVPAATDFGKADVIDVPGRPVPVATPGHTSGHTAYLVPGARVLLTGDALITGHPLSSTTGPQELMGFFHHDVAAVKAALDVIADVDADAIVPGHGPVYRGSPRDAVTHIRRG